MPLMTKIRERLAIVFSIFAGVFVVYIVLDWGMGITDLKQTSNQAESQEVGKIDDHPITYKEFSELLRRALDNQKTQTGSEPDENQQRAIRDQLWNQLIEQTLFDDQIEQLGIKITDQEIIDWVRGENPPDFLKQQFTDTTGTFNRQAYDGAIMDPKNKPIMVQLESALRKQRQREKLQSLITASVQVSESEIHQRFTDHNIKYEVEYAFFDPNILVKDDEVQTSDDELQRFYKDNLDDYKIEATRKFKYVLFHEIPSQSDTNDVTTEMEDILNRVQAGTDFDTLAKIYSETPPFDEYRGHGAFSPEIETAIFKAKAGDIVGPINDRDGYHLIKIKNFQPGKEEYVHASHILINIENNDSTAALNLAKTILSEIKSGKDFSELARTHSKDPGSGAKGGDLGWFGKGRMVKPFEEAAFKGKPGQVLGPIKSQFGYHIIKVHSKDNREVKVSDIHMTIRLSSRTRSEISQRAQDFSYLSKEGSFEKEAAQSRYNILETQSFQQDAVIPGIGMNNAVNKFAFKNKLGTVSEPFYIQKNYGVFMVSEVKEAGVRPLDEVKNVIESRVKREKKNEKIKTMAAELRQSLKSTDSLQMLSIKNPQVSVQHLEPFNLGSGYIQGIGRDLGFMGGIESLKPGELSNPILGSRGVYLAKVISKSAFDTTAYGQSKISLRSQVLMEKKNRFFSEWFDQLKKSAEIVDKRDLFYR
ncbi:MAG: peptidylprolyl isomerase [Bacteroidota bacterium]|nr:peptidylprolyl isomerase [Bacteroidota bacterium]